MNPLKRAVRLIYFSSSTINPGKDEDMVHAGGPDEFVYADGGAN